MIDLLVWGALTPFGGVGFALLVQTSPLGLIPHKPFTCRVCLSGWGSIVVAGALLQAAAQPINARFFLLWGALTFVGTGAARVIFTLSEALQAAADAQVLRKSDLGESAPPIDTLGA